jgi:hypothetical protein
MAATRFKIPDVPEVIFEIQQSNGKGDSELVEQVNNNISITGIAIKHNPKKKMPEIGGIIKGKLRKGERIIPTKIKVIHRTGNIIGCQFLEALPKIERFVSDEILKDLFPSLNLQSRT